MNHSFVPLKSNPTNCASCQRSIKDHLSSAICEQCGNTGLADLLNGILLCNGCKSDAIEGAKFTGVLPGAKALDYNKSESDKVYTTARSISAELPANASEFYNAKITAIIELEQRINNDPNIENKPYFFAQQIQARQQILFKALVETKEIITEIQSESSANYRALNALASRLKKEEREKLNIKYAEYIPASKIKRVSQPRMSAQDHVITGLAKMMFAPRKDGIIQWEALEASERQTCIEKAKQYFKGSLK